MTPEVFASSGFLERAQLELVCAEGPTFAGPSGSGAIDFFAVHMSVGQAVAAVERDVLSFVPSHTPVCLLFHPNVTKMKALRLHEPPRIPIVAPFGPGNRPPAWDRAVAACADFLEAGVRKLSSGVRGGGSSRRPFGSGTPPLSPRWQRS